MVERGNEGNLRGISVFDNLKLVDMKTGFGASSAKKPISAQPRWNSAETIVPWAGTSLCSGPSFNWSIPGLSLCEIFTNEFLIYD